MFFSKKKNSDDIIAFNTEVTPYAVMTPINSQNNFLTNNPSNTTSLNELYTLKEVYDIEFGVRGYWKCIFDNAPIKYKKGGGMIAKSCSESDYNNGFDAHRVGLIEVYTPGHLQMPTLQIEFYDDTESTIEKWLRVWKDSMKDKNTQTLTYIDSYVSKATIFQYNQHHVLQSTREYLVAPTGKISVTNESATATTISLNFIVFNMKIL